MSIPPLVCSTPPPPDQCEDDKDPEDFDIQYNLSQDEDDDNYDFGSFSTYNHYQSTQCKSEPVTQKIVDNKAQDPSTECAVITESYGSSNIIIEDKPKLEEESNIEDLHLEDLKMGQDITESIDIKETISDIKTSDSAIDSVSKIQESESFNENNCPDSSHEIPINSDEFTIEPLSIDQPEEPPSYVDEIIAAVDNLQNTPTESGLPLDIPDADEPILEPSPNVESLEVTIMSEISMEQKSEQNVDDDFGDFDDFQFTSPGVKPVILDNCDNPWDNNASSSDFGDFKANFDDYDNSKTNTTNTAFEKPEHTEAKEEFKAEKSCSTLASVINAPADDDFGDFNDFQSSAEFHPETDDESLNYPLLDLKYPINMEKVIENVNSVIYSIFEDEIPEPGEKFQGNLDSELGITWGHLLQTDERQPYMVNWNSSLGQKTLLKALCIDSRNILFGPKWSCNMPKFAATLSVAPLQPQKQVSSPILPQVETSNPEKSISKPPGTWTDPFTSDGQESCNPDTSSQKSVMETGPTDLDVFEASTSSKPDKIFSNTLNVQPLRQISLPDTHIFTPTDSETPRSTTIHYDNGPTVLLPQTVIDTTKDEPSFKSELPSNASPAENDDYWEFQDFKGPCNIPSTSLSSQKGITSNTNPTIYATQVLQPIKVEPIIPTLNWPDPGEVKETFDDFSNIVLNSSLSNPQQQLPTVPVQNIDSKPSGDGSTNTIAAPNERIPFDTSEDDEFDTFQSAKPPTSCVGFNFPSAVSGSTIVSPQAKTDFDFAFPKVELIKPDTISNENLNKLKDSSVQNQLSLFPNNSEVKNPPLLASNSTGMPTGLLQPTVSSTSGLVQNQQKSCQILQPLSLESYSQINWPNPGIDLQDLSRFNPVETLQSLKSDLSVNSQSKVSSPVNSQKSQKGAGSSQAADDDWGEFVSSAPKPQQQTLPKKQNTFVDDDEWTDFVSSPSVKPQNGLNTISLNVHTNFQSKPTKYSKGAKLPLDIPSLNYITPKANNHKGYNDRHFQNL